MRTQTQLVAGTGVIPNRETPLDLLRLQSAQAAAAVEAQQQTVAQLKRNYDIALERTDWTPEALADCRAQLVIATDRLTVARQNAIAKRGLLDAELGREAQQAEQDRLAAEFKVATDRLNKSRVAIEALKIESRELPNRMADAERTFRIALQLWNEARAVLGAAKWQRPTNGTH
jgi:hypothetical protein